MSRFGTTIKQKNAAIAKLRAAGFRAWGVATGHHYLWVQPADGDPTTNRISVPNVDQYIAKVGATTPMALNPLT
jgi:hypothetical protein